MPDSDRYERCPACPTDVRHLFAVAHNAVNAWRVSDESPTRFARKMAELETAVRGFQQTVDHHFNHGPRGSDEPGDAGRR